ncbi:competence protein CoiA [Vreelandella massiliensis]|uniref:competence protein CoiA n=1 Tax=Vreelandella massiliensis TaxID=1816686 RepID=UPI00096AC191|nr:competence protein CoiA family protein [Halomonas massiliensis]
MPLKCKLDGEPCFSFTYTTEDWEALKAARKQHDMRMPCCGRRAIPKTSSLGTPFFAHTRRGECVSGQETREHLLAKYLVARGAYAAGWSVDVEHRGETPDGEAWVADVFATKGKAKVALEVQWSPQSEDETRRRQERYRASGVRGAWFLRETRQYNPSFLSILSERATPSFVVRLDDSGQDFRIGWSRVSLSDFVADLLSGKVRWSPLPGEQGRVGPVVLEESCWKCHQPTGIVASMVMEDSQGIRVGALDYDDIRIREDLIRVVSESDLRRRHQIGPLKHRFSRTEGRSYFSNGCFHCGALQGRFFIREALLEVLVTDDPDPVSWTSFVFSEAMAKELGGWRSIRLADISADE